MTGRMFRLFGVALPVVAIALGTSAFAQDKPKPEAKPAPAAKQEVKKEEPKKEGQDIVATAVMGGLKTFSELIIQAGLVEELKKPGPFTVFAPTDDAFKAMGKELDDLKKPENKAKLADFLKGHIVAKKLELMKDKDAKPMHGADIKIADKDGKAMINGTIKVTKDLTATNGTIHEIDAAIKGEMKPEPKKDEAKKPEMKKEEPKKEDTKKPETKKK